MSRAQQPGEETTRVRDDQTVSVEAPSRNETLVYWNVCQGIPPITIDSPRDFFAAHAIVVLAGVAVMLVVLLIF
jgi:hypothetical protein